jgi:two-component system, OmpR family, sensor kinase
MHKFRPYFYPVISLAAVLILSILLWTHLFPDLLFIIRIDLGNIVFAAGTALVILWTVIIYLLKHSQQGVMVQVRLESADEKRRFLRRLDHELKNPLTAIRAGLANLSETKLEGIQLQTVDSIEAQALRLSRLLSDLRKLAELETRPLERSAVNINEMLQEAFNLALDQPNAANLDLKLNIPQAPWPLPSIQGDSDLLFLAVHNLLDNALKFTQPGGTIEVRGFEDGSSLVIEVGDTGMGIPEDELSHIGEELFRSRGARGIPGNGLGLALVQSIVNLHGGKVSLRSREGKGTVVTLRLPINS